MSRLLWSSLKGGGVGVSDACPCTEHEACIVAVFSFDPCRFLHVCSCQSLFASCTVPGAPPGCRVQVVETINLPACKCIC